MAAKVLVTGATGFIGRRLCTRLLADGNDVRALLLPHESPDALRADAESAGRPEAIEFARGDIIDDHSVTRAVAGVDRVYHLAAAVGDWGDPGHFWQVNVEGTRHVLDAAAATGCERVLMVSSIVVYGMQLRRGVCREDAPMAYGVGPYSKTKRASEALARDYHDMGRVPVTVVRPGNVYGAHSRLWVHVLADLLRRGQGLLIDGGRGDAAMAYVDNVVDVIARAADTPAAAGRIYNATDGSRITWRQYMTDLAHLVGARPPFLVVPFLAAQALAITMERGARLLRRRNRPLLTHEAVLLLASRQTVPITRAERELGYQPIAYHDAMARVAAHLQEGSP